MDYVRDGDIQPTGPLFSLFKSTLPLYFTISDIVHNTSVDARALITDRDSTKPRASFSKKICVSRNTQNVWTNKIVMRILSKPIRMYLMSQ